MNNVNFDIIQQVREHTEGTGNFVRWAAKRLDSDIWLLFSADMERLSSVYHNEKKLKTLYLMINNHLCAGRAINECLHFCHQGAVEDFRSSPCEIFFCSYGLCGSWKKIF